MSIAEKILDGRIIKFPGDETMSHEGIKRNVLAAMQSYADFYYWLGRSGWTFEDGVWVNDMFQTTSNISDLYEQYIKTKV